jgi:outer membrane protein assembly factor BamB
MRDWLVPNGEPLKNASVAVIVWLVSCAAAFSQLRQAGAPAEARRELAAPQVELVSGATLARLEQVRGLAKDQNWDEAVDILQELAGDDSGRVVEFEDGRFVTLRTYCHLQLSGSPPAALAVYRRSVDPLADRWYRDGLSARDERLLARVVDELFCSSWGDDALLALGELALERADYAAARRCWEQISPLLRDPTGRPIWLALRDIDLSAKWPEIERRWRDRSRKPTWLAYPDTNLDLADVRARLVLASIRAGELNRARLELDVFRRLHPQATGRFGGQNGLYVDALERLFAAAKEWPADPPEPEWVTYGGSPARLSAAPRLGPITGPAWAEPIQLSADAIVRRDARRVRFPLGPFVRVEELEPPAAVDSARPLSCFPVVSHAVVLFSDGKQIRAAELATGRPALTGARPASSDESIDSREPVAYGVPRHTLTVADGIVYGRVGRLATTRLDAAQGTPGDRLMGLDLAREGLLVFRARPENATWSFDGAPVSDGRRLYVAMRQGDVMPRAYVACYDAADGSTPLWRTPIGSAETPGGGLGDEITHNLLTLAGDRIFVNTNLGLVAAIDTNGGRICWLRRYNRRLSQPIDRRSPLPAHFDRDPSPCLYKDGMVVVAPADTFEIFALDASTGKLIWSTDQLPDGLHLLGVARRNLIVGGHRLAALDVLSGTLKYRWPDSEHSGIRGMGRGVIAGDEVFWPTRNEIYVIHAMTGGQSRNPIPLGSVSSSGANLAAAHRRLIVAGPDKVMAFGPMRPVAPKQNDAKNQPLATSN